MCCISSASSSLTHRMASPPFQQHPGLVLSLSLAKKCRLLLSRVRHFKNLGVRWKSQEKRMCLNSILDNEGVWCKRICGYSWKTCNGDYTPCTPVTCSPSFHLQHPAQGRDVHSTSHSTAHPSGCITLQSESQAPQHSAQEFAGPLFCLTSWLERSACHPSEPCLSPPLHHEPFADRF